MFDKSSFPFNIMSFFEFWIRGIWRIQHFSQNNKKNIIMALHVLHFLHTCMRQHNVPTKGAEPGLQDLPKGQKVLIWGGCSRGKVLPQKRTLDFWYLTHNIPWLTRFGTCSSTRPDQTRRNNWEKTVLQVTQSQAMKVLKVKNNTLNCTWISTGSLCSPWSKGVTCAVYLTFLQPTQLHSTSTEAFCSRNDHNWCTTWRYAKALLTMASLLARTVGPRGFSVCTGSICSSATPSMTKVGKTLTLEGPSTKSYSVLLELSQSPSISLR